MNSLPELSSAFLDATLQTLLMVAVAVFFCAVFGLLLGSWLAVTSPDRKSVV